EVKAILNQGVPFAVRTSNLGEYSLEVQDGVSVRVVPRKNTGDSEGLSTADLIDMQRHILQKKSLESKYQRIAADVNGNGRIEGLDVLELRRLVLDPSRTFSNNSSWRFYENTSGKEALDIDQVSADYQADFTAVKIGDVNLSGDPANTDRSTNGQLHLTLK